MQGEEVLIALAGVALVALLVSPIVSMILAFKLRSEQKRQARLLESLLRRGERGDRQDPVPEPAPVPPPHSVPAPAARPVPPPPVLLAVPPCVVPEPATPPPVPVPPAIPVRSPAAAPVRPQAESEAPEEPGVFQAKARAILHKIWNWIMIGDEYRRPGTSWEYAVATNWLLRAGIIVVVVGVGFFLKYSIEHGMLGPYARVALCLVAGLGMVTGGVKLMGKPYQLFGQGLMGGGLAILYFSIYASFQLYHLIGMGVAFGVMALVTLVAGTLAVRLNSLLVAVLGILGGYGTPLMLSTGSGNFPGLLGYMLLLGVGILGIARRRNWPLLNYLGMLLTYGLASAAIGDAYRPVDFLVVLPFLIAFFVLYSVVMIVHNLVSGAKAGLFELLGTLANALAFSGLVHHVITQSYPVKYSALPALALAVFYILLVRSFLLAGKRDKGLLYTFLGLAALFTAMTPPLAFSRQWVTVSWALQGVVMLWLAGKIGSRFLALLGSSATFLAVGRLICWDMPHHYNGWIPPGTTWATYLAIAGERLLSTGVPIACLGAAWRLLRKPPQAGGLVVASGADMATVSWQSGVAAVIACLGAVLLFVYAHIELYQSCGFFWPSLAVPSMTIAWFGMGLFLLAVLGRHPAKWVPGILVFLVVGLVIKLLLVDVGGWSLDSGVWQYEGDYLAGPVLIRLGDFGLCLGLFWQIFARTRGRDPGRGVGLAAGIIALALLWFYLSLEVNTALGLFVPGLRAGGLTLLWAAYALALLLFGLGRSVRGLRYAGLAGFAVVIVKIFLFDLASLDALYKIVAFIMLGLMLLTGALVYLKFRQRFQPDRGGAPQ